jgi:DNA-binding CsgD family transcriptional regulator
MRLCVPLVPRPTTRHHAAPRRPAAGRRHAQERTVAALVASGLTNREVAASMLLSVKTVQFHLTRVHAKLGVRSRSELAARFVREPS